MTTWLAPFSENISNRTAVPTGMLLASTATSTGEPSLIVTSGRAKLAVGGSVTNCVPLMSVTLVTLSVGGGPPVGKFKLNGAASATTGGNTLQQER